MVQNVRPREGVKNTDTGILRLIKDYNIGRLKIYSKGEVIYWQGAPTKYVSVVKSGAVKSFSVSREGKVHIYEILGEGNMVGIVDCLLGEEFRSTVEALEDTDVYLIPKAEFESLIYSNLSFSVILMRQLAQTARSLAREVKELSMMDMQQRLKHHLVRLANDHGLILKKGIKIDLAITHEEIAELVAGNRSTVTTYLNELKKQGYLWKEDKRLVSIPIKHFEILDGLSRSVVEKNEKEAVSWVAKAIDEEVGPVKVMNALVRGMKQIDSGFTRKELSISDVMMAVSTMKSAMSVVEKKIRKMEKKFKTPGIVIIGTVSGDIHDMGKAVVAALLTAEGFKVVDLGVNVNAMQFIDAISEYKPDILAMSALMTVTVPEQERVINILKKKGLRDKVRIIVGGGAVTRDFARYIEADGYEATAHEAVEMVKNMI